MKRVAALVLMAVLTVGGVYVLSAPQDKLIGVNVVLKTGITKAALAELGRFGRVRDEIPALNAVTMQARESELASIQALPFVASASARTRNGTARRWTRWPRPTSRTDSAPGTWTRST